MKKIITLCLLCLSGFGVYAQLLSPDEFLGYPLGSRFTPHHKVVEYFKQATANTPNARLKVYGKTYEGRELLMAIVSDADNIARLEQIRQQNLSLATGDKKSTAEGGQPAVLWLSYNVHGNEASSTETSMRVLYILLQGKDGHIKQWLKNTVVIIDPCLNPDGRERYVGNFNSVSGIKPNPDPSAREHSEPWPGGRSNHYYFDLNRDWAWQTQVESQQRLKAYHEWLPQVHVDFHEQGYNDPYYFAPAAEPIHRDITPWQRDFQVIIGKNNAKYFDQNGWQYFTKERFDLLYPSYGDTYPLYNGAIGMTYEQGGIRAGLAVVTYSGDTLTLKDRIDHHFTTSIATLETVSGYADKLVSEFKKFYEQSRVSPPGPYKSYIVKAESMSRLRTLGELLRKNNISYAFGGAADRTLSGYNFETQKTESFKLERNDLVLNLSQPHAVMANVLFEPQTMVTDSNTYDITAWSLPYVYGLKAYGLKESIQGGFDQLAEKAEKPLAVSAPYAWAMSWNNLGDAKALIALQQRNLKVRLAGEAFSAGGKAYPAGTLLVYRAENQKAGSKPEATLDEVSRRFGVSFFPLSSGLVEKGKDLGSSVYRLLNMPKVALYSGQEASSLAVGEVWHFFEQELGYPLTLLANPNFSNLDINKVNVLVMPDGNYSDKMGEQLQSWLAAGGKLILLDDAVSAVQGKRPFDIKKKELPKNTEKPVSVRRYADRNKDDLDNTIPGAIFRVELDATHPLSAGLGKYYYTLKMDEKTYEPLENGWNVGMLKENSYMAGVAGEKVKKKLSSGLLLGTQAVGRGVVVYLATDPLFRAFWESGKQLFTNAVFLAY